MSNRNQLVDGLHAILLELWEGSDEIAAAAFRKLMSWAVRTAKPEQNTYRAGNFPGPQFSSAPDQDFLVQALVGMQKIEAAFNSSDAKAAAQGVKDLLVALSEPQVSATVPVV